MRLRARLLFATATAALWAASPATAARVHEPAPAGFVRWLAPAAGSDWVAGEPIVLAWAPGPAFAAGAGAPRIEEWEAFLSLDDGATWPVRLTPHLDVRLRRFEVELPLWASPRARLLFRFGDERRELEVEAPGPIRIGPPRRTNLAPARRAWRSGEPARSGSAGTAAWLEGSRRGRALARFEAEGADPDLARTLPGRPPALLPAATEAGRALSLGRPDVDRVSTPGAIPVAATPAAIREAGPLSPRLAGCRWNC